MKHPRWCTDHKYIVISSITHNLIYIYNVFLILNGKYQTLWCLVFCIFSCQCMMAWRWPTFRGETSHQVKYDNKASVVCDWRDDISIYVRIHFNKKISVFSHVISCAVLYMEYVFKPWIGSISQRKLTNISADHVCCEIFISWVKGKTVD
jgi:hypothetical protein